MKAKESLDMKGRVTIRLSDREGRLVKYLEADNDIVISGRELMADLLVGSTNAKIQFLAVGKGGDGSTKPVPNETTLLSQVGDRKLITFKDPEITTDNKIKLTLSAEFDLNEGNGELKEAGLFTAEVDGIMYNRVVFPTINKTNGFKLSLIWEIIF